MISSVHGQIVSPPCTGHTLELMGGEERSLVVLAPKESEFLLDSPQPMIGVKRILSTREGGLLSPEKIREVITASGPTSSMRGHVSHKSFEEHRLSLTVLFNLHKHIRRTRRWRRWRVVLIGTLRKIILEILIGPHPVVTIR